MTNAPQDYDFARLLQLTKDYISAFESFRNVPNSPSAVEKVIGAFSALRMKGGERKLLMCALKSELPKVYPCTTGDYRACSESFSSRADWTAHESTHHEQNECYRCDGNHLRQGVRCCEVLFVSHDAYKSHLRSCGVKEYTVSAEANRCRIPANNQGSFWCGFCVTVQSCAFGREALKGRRDHIIGHLESLSPRPWVSLHDGDQITPSSSVGGGEDEADAAERRGV